MLWLRGITRRHQATPAILNVSHFVCVCERERYCSCCLYFCSHAALHRFNLHSPQHCMPLFIRPSVKRMKKVMLAFLQQKREGKQIKKTTLSILRCRLWLASGCGWGEVLSAVPCRRRGGCSLTGACGGKVISHLIIDESIDFSLRTVSLMHAVLWRSLSTGPDLCHRTCRTLMNNNNNNNNNTFYL